MCNVDDNSSTDTSEDHVSCGPDTNSTEDTPDEKIWNIISSKMRTDSRNTSNSDITVKVNSNVYELHRLTLALKSDYFDKLFTSNYKNEIENDFEISALDSYTFSTLVYLMYGGDLRTVLTFDNFTSLLLSMDYLQMQIDLEIFHDFMTNNIEIPLALFTDVFKLLDLISGNRNFGYLLPTIYQYLSLHLIEVFQFEDFFSLPYDVLSKIITKNQFPRYTKEKQIIARICTEWICKDIENRRLRMADLVNAAKHRYGFRTRVDEQSTNTQFLLDMDDEFERKKAMEIYFDGLLNQKGQIYPSKQKPDESNPTPNTASDHRIVNEIDENAKWCSYLKNNHFCDVTVKAGEKLYRLHRYKLESKSDYFAAKFRERDETRNSSNSDEVLQLEGIDEPIFETIIKFMYRNVIDFDSNVKISDLLIASGSLNISELLSVCKAEISTHLYSTRINDEFIKIFNFFFAEGSNDDFKKTRDDLYSCIISTWPKVGTFPEFCSIPLVALKTILASKELKIHHPDEILTICSKWIAQQPLRYGFLPEIAHCINRYHTLQCFNRVMEYLTDSDDYSEEFVKNKLLKMLRSFSSIVSNDNLSKDGACSLAQQLVFFATLKGYNNYYDILDFEFNRITTIQHLNPSYFTMLSTVLIKDNLFMFFRNKKKDSFQVYNFSTRKIMSLARFRRPRRWDRGEVTLLNCNDELYGCLENGAILKYSLILNRWMVIEDEAREGNRMQFTGNGSTLFRINRRSTKPFSVVAEKYDFDETVWIALPRLPTQFLQPKYFEYGVSLTAVNDDLAISFNSTSYIIFFDHKLRSWHNIEAPFRNSVRGIEIGACTSTIANDILIQREDNIVCIWNRQLWNALPSDGKWILNELELPPFKYKSIDAIHSVCQ